MRVRDVKRGGGELGGERTSNGRRFYASSILIARTEKAPREMVFLTGSGKKKKIGVSRTHLNWCGRRGQGDESSYDG